MAFSKETANVIHMSIAVLILYGAFFSQSAIEEPVIERFAGEKNMNPHAGYYSLAITYGFFTLANLITAPIVEIFGTRLTITLSSLPFVAFYAGFFFLNTVYLYATSALVGATSAVLWTAQGKYLAENSNTRNANRHSAIFVAVSTLAMALAGAMLLIVFKTGDSHNIDRPTMFKLYGVFIVVSLLGTLSFALMRRPDLIDSEANAAEPLQYKALLTSTFKLMFTSRMLLQATAHGYTGITLGFATSILTTAISFTSQFGNASNSIIGWSGVVQGIGWITGGLFCELCTTRSKIFGRKWLVAIGTVIHLSCYALIGLFFPAESPIRKTAQDGIFPPSVTVAIICAFLIGFGGSCWWIEIYTLILFAYPNLTSQAFALYNLFQTLMAAVCFFYGATLDMRWQMVILSASAIVALFCFSLADILITRDNRRKVRPLEAELK